MMEPKQLVSRDKPAKKSFPQKIFKRIRDVLGLSLLQERLIEVERTLDFLASRAVDPNPVDKFITQSSFYFHGGHFDDHYIEWRVRRIMKILQIFGPDYFKGKRVLELGGALGDIGGFFASLGAEVVSLEGWRSNVNYANLRFATKYNYKAIEMDLEKDFSHIGKFDLIINFGFLECIKDTDSVLRSCIQIADEVVLETEVCDSTDKDKILHLTVKGHLTNDHPLGGTVSSYPSPAYLEAFFKKHGFNAIPYFDHDLNTDLHKYDWKHTNSGLAMHGQRRFWRFSKNAKGTG